MNLSLAEIIGEKEAAYGLSLAPETRLALARYHALVMDLNALLHLVAPCSEEDFAMRHVLESLTMLEFLPNGATITDIGAGAGLPSIPCLLARSDLGGTLIESKPKKAAFLESVIAAEDIAGRVHVVEKQFEEAARPDSGFVVCRALDKFTTKLPRIFKWAAGRDFLFFGGPSLRVALEKEKVAFREILMPFSEQRYLFAGHIPARASRGK